MKRPAAILFCLLASMAGPSTTGALEVRISPEKSPASGADMSGGVVVIRETGDVTALSADGQCWPPVAGYREELTLEVYVPGYVPAVRTCRPGDVVTLYLALQAFEAEAIVVDLGLGVSQAVAARGVCKEAAEEAATAPPPESTDGPAIEPALGFNPFAIIETIIGESIPEILGIDD